MNQERGGGPLAHTPTLQRPDGERAEFATSGHVYGLMAEGDEGNLVSQGTKIRSFERFRQTDQA